MRLIRQPVTFTGWLRGVAGGVAVGGAAALLWVFTFRYVGRWLMEIGTATGPAPVNANRSVRATEMSVGGWAAVLVAGSVLSPIMEELAFRLPVCHRRSDWFTGIASLAVAGAAAWWLTSIGLAITVPYWLILPALAVVALWPLWRRLIGGNDDVIGWVLAVMFGVIHIANYTSGRPSGGWALYAGAALMVIPQTVGGFVYLTVARNHGLAASIVCHGLWNASVEWFWLFGGVVLIAAIWDRRPLPEFVRALLGVRDRRVAPAGM